MQGHAPRTGGPRRWRLRSKRPRLSQTKQLDRGGLTSGWREWLRTARLAFVAPKGIGEETIWKSKGTLEKEGLLHHVWEPQTFLPLEVATYWQFRNDRGHSATSRHTA